MMDYDHAYCQLQAAYREMLQSIRDLHDEGDPSSSVVDLEIEAWGMAQALALMQLELPIGKPLDWRVIQEQAYMIEQEENHE